MAVDDGAGADDDLDGQLGSGAPKGGSPEGGSDNDDKPITAKQLKAALESQKRHYEGQLQGQRAEFESFKEGVGKREQPRVEQPKVYAKADLKAAVAAGSISQEQSDDIWERQQEAQITARAETAALNAVTASQAKERIDSDLAKYKRLAPEILDKASEERQKIVTKYRRMVANGLPDNLATELEAIEAVMGPLEKLEKARSVSRHVEHDEQGGSSGERGKGGSGKTLADKLAPRYKEHYEAQIKSGRYKDWKEVEAEIKFATPQRRQQMGLPN